ncbi:hypothetical protein CPB86DRAFT_793207 [Serendipita vermifera]|nr:hypothetical protein CPB86DRAFT_793207 [Serendipita vermifera]
MDDKESRESFVVLNAHRLSSTTGSALATPPIVTNGRLDSTSVPLLEGENSPGNSTIFTDSYKLNNSFNPTTTSALTDEKWRTQITPQRIGTGQMEAAKRIQTRSSVRARCRLQQFDPVSRRLDVNWAIQYIQYNETGTVGSRIDKFTDIGIYRDQDLVPLNSSYEQFSPVSVEETSDTRVSTISATPIAVVGRSRWDSFSTEIDMGQTEVGNPWKQPQFGFPFDHWSGSIAFVASAPGYARRRGLVPTARGVEIDDAVILDSLMNWRITLVPNNTCVGKDSEGRVWVWASLDPCTLRLSFTAERTGLVKFATVIAVLVNWLSTIFIFIMTCEGVIMQRYQVLVAPQLLAVCLTSLFALPSVRSILPGAPEFGALMATLTTVEEEKKVLEIDEDIELDAKENLKNR